MICLVCHSTHLRYLTTFHRGGKIYVCTRCGNALTVPPPEVIYDNHPFYAAGVKEYGVVRSYALPLVRFICKHRNGGTLLDVGTGAGILLEVAKEAGFDAWGIEPSAHAVAYCTQRTLRVKHGYFMKTSFPAHSFDIIVASHVVEHVMDAHAFVDAAHRLLKPGGLLILAQTNYRGSIPRLLGPFWEGWVASEHRIHFSPSGVDYFLTRHRYEVEEIAVVPLGYRLLWRWGNPRVLLNNFYSSMNYIMSTLRIGFPFIGDQMYIAARVI